MAAPSRISLERQPLRVYLMVFIVIIIVCVAGILTTISYLHVRGELIAQSENIREYSERNVLGAVQLVDTGLRLYDSTLNSQMEGAFAVYTDAYNASSGDISRMDLDALRQTLQPGFSGRLDCYIINESGVIVASTVPEVMGLDFRQFPDFYQSITRLRLGNTFGADRVVRSIPSTGNGTVTGTLRKFAYMPTPDHRYLLELGLESDAFFRERTDLSYAVIAGRLKDLNPNLVSVRIVDVNHVLVSTEAGTNGTLVNDPAIDRALSGRISYSTADPVNHTKTTYLFADLKDPGAASDMSLVIELVYSSVLLERSLWNLLVTNLLAALVGVGLGVSLAYGASRFITRPMREIIDDVDTIARGDLDHPIRGMQNPEFISLENSITTMIQRIRKYSEELEREKAELQIASQIQLSFLPRSIPRVPGFDIAAVSIPAREVGGDFYDFIGLSPGKTGVVIADVAGKGVPAALFMVLSRTTVRASTRMTGVVARAMEDANRMIAADADRGMFVTLFFGILDQETRIFSYANAGHNPPLHYQAVTGSIQPLQITGIALGVVEDELYGQEELALHPGDVLVFYTDGVIEAHNKAWEQFGEGRLEALIREHNRLPAMGLLERIQEEVAAFAAGEQQFDDITLVVIRVE